MKTILLFILTVGFSVEIVGQIGQPIVKYGGAQKAPRIIQVSNMLGDTDGFTCKKSNIINGTIVKRDFEEDETMISSFVLKDAKDNRKSVNVDSMQIWLLGREAPRIVSSLLEKNAQVKVWTSECTGGGSGVFIYADKIQRY